VFSLVRQQLLSSPQVTGPRIVYERNVVMGSLSEGTRVAATSGRSIADGQRAAGKLLREALGRRIAASVPVRGAVESGLVVLRADAILPSFVPGLPGLHVHMTAAMHKEEDLAVHDQPTVHDQPLVVESASAQETGA
jgi:hypothetical protein